MRRNFNQLSVAVLHQTTIAMHQKDAHKIPRLEKLLPHGEEWKHYTQDAKLKLTREGALLILSNYTQFGNRVAFALFDILEEIKVKAG